MKTRSILALILLLAPGTLAAQGVPGRPRPAPTVPTGPPMPNPGAGQGAAPCDLIAAQPSITLTLEPAGPVFPGDQVTLRWQVRHRVFQPNQTWTAHVNLQGSAPTNPALPRNPVGNTGSHVFSAGAAGSHLTITLSTLCGTESVRQNVETAPVLRSITPVRGTPGTVVFLNGEQFGDRQGESRVLLASGGSDRTMSIRRWSAGVIEAIVPDQAPTGDATIRVSKARRIDSARRDFHVGRRIVVDTAMARLAADDAGLSAVQVVVTDGANASQVTLGGGLPALSFTVQGFQRDVPDAANIVEVVLAPIPGLPIPKKVRFRAHDIRSNSVDVSVAGGQLVLAVGFEEQGAEVVGEARTCFWAVAGCVDPAWRDEHCPDIQASRARITFRLTPGVSGGALTFPSADDDFQADFQIRGFAGWLAPLLGDWSGQAKRRIRDAIHDTLNTAAVRNAAATAVMARLRGLGVERIVSVTPNGNQITVEYE